jgi:hypothetical protein
VTFTARQRHDTNASTTDPEALPCRKGKGKETKLSYLGNALTELRVWQGPKHGSGTIPKCEGNSNIWWKPESRRCPANDARTTIPVSLSVALDLNGRQKWLQ